MMTTTDKELFEYTEQKLTAHYQVNDELILEMGNAFNYYNNKLAHIIKESDKDRVENELFTSIKSQIFNGYFMACEILSNNEFPEHFFSQSKGVIAQQVPDLLREATNFNIEGVVTDSHLQNFISWLVVEYEDVYDLLMDISLNTACIGTKWAFYDFAEKQNISLYQPQYEGLLTKIDEITFINPQTYLTCMVSTDTSEVWDIITSQHKGLEKIGEATIIISNQNMNEETYYMNISLRNTLTLSEQQTIIDQLGSNLLVNQEIERKQLKLNASSVEEYYYINNPV